HDRWQGTVNTTHRRCIAHPNIITACWKAIERGARLPARTSVFTILIGSCSAARTHCQRARRSSITNHIHMRTQYFTQSQRGRLADHDRSQTTINTTRRGCISHPDIITPRWKAIERGARLPARTSVFTILIRPRSPSGTYYYYARRSSVTNYIHMRGYGLHQRQRRRLTDHDRWQGTVNTTHRRCIAHPNIITACWKAIERGA